MFLCAVDVMLFVSVLEYVCMYACMHACCVQHPRRRSRIGQSPLAQTRDKRNDVNWPWWGGGGSMRIVRWRSPRAPPFTTGSAVRPSTMSASSPSSEQPFVPPTLWFGATAGSIGSRYGALHDMQPGIKSTMGKANDQICSVRDSADPGLDEQDSSNGQQRGLAAVDTYMLRAETVLAVMQTHPLAPLSSRPGSRRRRPVDGCGASWQIGRLSGADSPAPCATGRSRPSIQMRQTVSSVLRATSIRSAGALVNVSYLGRQRSGSPEWGSFLGGVSHEACMNGWPGQYAVDQFTSRRIFYLLFFSFSIF